VPVKSTFIHFDVPLQLPTALQRAATCPPRLHPSLYAVGADGWEAAMQELCQVMAPRRERDGATACSEGPLGSVGALLAPQLQECNDDSRSAAKDSEQQELENPETDRISEASTKESSGAGTPEASGTPNAPDMEAAVQQWTSYAPRKRASQGRADKRASAAAAQQQTQQQSCHSSGASDALATQRAGFKGKGLSHFERIEVGIEDDRDFRVVQRLIGPRGKHMQDITVQCKGSKVWIIGRGSRSWEDSVGPLVVCVGATSRSAFDSATGLVRELLQRVHDDHARFRR